MKLIFYLIVFYLAYRLVKSILFPARIRRTGPQPWNEGRGGASAGSVDYGSTGEKAQETALDPVCNAYIVQNPALSVRDGSTTTYFCSEECKTKFLSGK